MKQTDRHTYIKSHLYHSQVEYSFDDIVAELEKSVSLQVKLTNVLKMLVERTGSTQAAIYQVHEGHVLPRRFQWPTEADTALNTFKLERTSSLNSLGLSRWEETLSNNTIIAGNTSECDGKEQEFLQRDGGKSFIVIPLTLKQADWWGFIEITDSREERKWPQETKDFLYAIAEHISSTIYNDEVNASKSMTNTDMIELRLREELLSAELEEINRWKNQMLSAFSHEFQTPLYTLLGFSKTLLENEELDNDKEIRMTCLQHIYEQSRRLEKLVNNLMFASRLHAKTLYLEKQRIDLRSVLNAVRTWGMEKASAMNIEFYSEFPTIPVIITCDPGKVERMLQNILENAFINTAEPGWVSMKVFAEQHDIIILIADTGAGIPKDQMTRIFEPFFSAPTRQGNDSGVGLGLSIAKEIVDLHHGFITVESKEGEGSVFTITLPRNNTESVRALQ